MNYWTQLSAKFAQNRNYLDELYKVYPITPNLRRVLPFGKEDNIKDAFENRDNESLINELLDLDLFPIKDSYVAYLRRDRAAIKRNPQTINRIAGNLYHMGFEEVIEKCTEPKETNRQMGPMFKNWIDKGVIGVPVFKNAEEFLSFDGNCILNTSDDRMQEFAKIYLGFERKKGLDFMAKFNNTYVVGEAKFLTDFGGHQNAQFEDAISTITADFSNKKVAQRVVPIAILDGVLYIEGNHKLYNHLKDNEEEIILSALVLREFLYQL